MADDKQGRDKQAHGAERRQRQREIEAELERMGDPEPPVDTSELAYVETELEAMEFPATGADIVETVGDHEPESAEGNYTVGELVPDTEAETFDSAAAVREQVQRPTIAAAMKRVVEESQTLQGEKLSGSQYDAYRKTFLALKGIDADDDDEGIRAISDWIVEQLHEKEKLPGSRAVRRQAATFCRAEGYEIRNDEWLGIYERDRKTLVWLETTVPPDWTLTATHSARRVRTPTSSVRSRRAPRTQLSSDSARRPTGRGSCSS